MKRPDTQLPVAPDRRPLIPLPPGSTDCHAHVFGPQHCYPMLAETHFVPHETPFAMYREMLLSLGCQRAVLVQPSVYGTDNRMIEDAVLTERTKTQAGIELRAVGVVSPDVTDRELERLHALGFRGIRINLAAGTPGLKLADALPLARRIEHLGWHLQLYADFELHPEVADALAALPVSFVIDHFGRVRGGQSMEASAPRALLHLFELDHCWVKLSGVYFVSEMSPRHDDLAELVSALLAQAPHRLVWGTDWPHVSARQRMPTDSDLCDALASWIPDETARRRVLVDNPAQLYGFA
ncbi:amidohydrolase family protein [soil metagenome]